MDAQFISSKDEAEAAATVAANIKYQVLVGRDGLFVESSLLLLLLVLAVAGAEVHVVVSRDDISNNNNNNNNNSNNNRLEQELKLEAWWPRQLRSTIQHGRSSRTSMTSRSSVVDQ